MSIKEIDLRLKAFIKDENAKNTAYDEKLSIIFGNSIAEYLEKELDPSSTKRIKKTIDKYFSGIGDKVSSWAKENGLPLKDFDYFKDSYFRDLCFPDTKKTAVKETVRLIVIFNFLVEKLSKEQIDRWIKKASENNNPKKALPPLPIPFSGTIRINQQFIDTLPKEDISSTDFYLAKDNKHSQWVGIVNGWDKERSIHSTLLSVIRESFNNSKANIISAIVSGHGGTGKSTALRRVCYELRNENIAILWITSISLFFTELSKINSNEKHLLVIEDWSKIKADARTNNSFFNHISNCQNIRVVIGDRSTVKRLYLEYINKKHIFKLKADENTSIIEKVLTTNREWRPIFEKEIQNTNISKTSIYLILFILARISSISDKELLIKTESVESKFEAIILYDLATITKKFPGLALGLGVWSKIQSSHRINISWEAFLMITKILSPENEGVFPFEKEIGISDIVSFYLSFEPLTAPLLPRAHVFTFHHELLAQTLGRVFAENYCEYDDKIIGSFFGLLLVTGHWNSAASFLAHIPYDNQIFIDVPRPFPGDIALYLPLDSLIEFSGKLEDMYQDAAIIKENWYWELQLLFILYYRFIGPRDDYSIKIILKTIIENGCSANCVLDAYNHANDMEYLEEMLKFLIYKHMKEYPESGTYKTLMATFRKYREIRKLFDSI